mgnify:CR=1 FL=1
MIYAFFMFHKFTKRQYTYLNYFFLFIVTLVLSSCARHSEPTLLLNVSYHDARKLILENGWKPAEIKRDEYGMDSISHFLDLGYTEVDACSGTGKGYCRFVFQNDLGLFMEVTTQEAPFAGDRIEMKNLDDAVVIFYGITDKID